MIETKNHSGFFKIYGNDWYKRSSGQKMERNPGNHVRLNAFDLSNFLNDNLSRKIWITGVVTLLENNFKVVKKPKYYNVVGANDLIRFILRNDSNKLDKETVNIIVYLMQDYCAEVYYKKEDVEVERNYI